MKRIGAVPPMVTALIVAAFMISAVLVGWYVVSVTASASRQVLISVIPMPTVVGDKLYIGLRNDGTVPFEGDVEIILSQGNATVRAAYPSSVEIAPGHSVLLEFSLGTTLQPGKAEGVVVGKGEQSFSIRFTAEVISP